jgi:hypothetical protein
VDGFAVVLARAICISFTRAHLIRARGNEGALIDNIL